MKKLLAIALALTLAWSLAVPALAATAPAVSLEQAITTAKAAFAVPAACEKFFSEFEDYNDRQQWRLTWRSADGNQSVSMMVDATTGAVVNYYSSNYGPTGVSSRLPKLTLAAAKAIADATIKRLQPAEAAQVRYVEPTYQPGYLPDRGTMSYSFSYERVVEGIPFSEHGFSVGVDGNTGTVLSYSFNWKIVEFPALTGQLDIAAANRIFGEKIGVKAIWWRPTPKNGEGQPLRLVYTVDRGNRMIDALTGETIDSQVWGYGMGGEANKQVSDSSARSPLTPSEQVAVEELARYQTVETAEATARRLLSLGSEYVRNSAYLSADNEFPENAKAWNLNFVANEGTDRVTWAYAQLDAATGALLGFSMSTERPTKEETQPTYSRTQAQAIAEQYIKAADATKAGQVTLIPPEYPIDEKTVSQHTFNFVRVHDGIQYPANGFEVTVDAYTGKVTNYRLRWADLAFPTSEGMLTKDDMTAKLLAIQPLTLAYRTVEVNAAEGVRPVYFLQGYAFAYDATTGQPVDYNGDPVVKLVRPAFTDIAGNKYEAEIRTLIDLGLIDGSATTFRPNDVITMAEFLKLVTSLNNAPNPRPCTDEPWYKVYVDAAREQSLILDGEQVDPNSAITRAAAARYLVRSLGLGYVAKLSVYQLPSGDAKVTADRGALALAWGFGILKADGNTLRPLAKVTRGEAAALIVNLLRVER